MRAPLDDPVLVRSFLESSPDFVAISDFDGNVLWINAAGLDLIGLPGTDRSDLPVERILTSRGIDVVRDIDSSLRQRGSWRGYSELRHQVTGAGIPVVVALHLLRRGHEPDLVAATVRDRRSGERLNSRMVASAALAGRHAEEQRALAELSRLAVDAELPQLLAAATSTATTLMAVGQSGIARPSEHNESLLNVVATSGMLGPRNGIPSGSGSMLGYAMSRREPVTCADASAETRFDNRTMLDMGLASGVAVPIFTVTGEVWGILSAHSTDVRSYPEEEVSFLASVAGIVSAALRRIDLQVQLRRRSTHDALTGLPNRVFAYEVIDGALQRARASSTRVALLLLDIDDFKIINDSLGHVAGDDALVHFVDRLTSATREQDTVARLGGDEFLILCEGIDSVSHAEDIARHITTSIALPTAADQVPIPLSASIGIAVSDPSTTRHDLINRADLAMYRAKDGGTGGHAVFDPTDLYDADRIRSLSVDLRAALANSSLTLVYQPLVDISTGRTVALEALARWSHPRLGSIDPTEFVGVAERTGLAMTLGAWALRTACADAVEWRSYSSVVVRVNVSALQLRDPTFPAQVADILAETGLPASALGLEVTETVWVSDTERVADTLSGLHGMGVALLLDDMGKGHSSMSYLDRYPMFESFKIDKSYIERLPAPRARAIVTAIVALAQAFDVTVVGEGVETREQLNALAASGCDLAQGFLLGRPVDAEATTALLQSMRP